MTLRFHHEGIQFSYASAFDIKSVPILYKGRYLRGTLYLKVCSLKHSSFCDIKKTDGSETSKFKREMKTLFSSTKASSS
jgi:hypothetical protein